MEAHWTRIPGEDGQPPSILEINTDISARKASEREVQRLAFYDALTGLPNRMLLMDRMQALASAERQRQGGALLFIDLDNFKTRTTPWAMTWATCCCSRWRPPGQLRAQHRHRRRAWAATSSW